MLLLLVFHLGLCGILLALHVILFIFLFKNCNVLHGNYYNLLRFSSLIDIYTFLVNDIFLHLLPFPEMVPIYRFLSEIPGIGWIYWLPTATFHLFALKIILLSVYRLLIIVKPLEGDEVLPTAWKIDNFQLFRPWLYPTILAIPLISFIMTVYIPLENPRLVIYEDRSTWITDENTTYFKMTLPLSIGYLFLIFSITVASFVLMRKHTNMAKTVRRLTLVSLVSHLMQSCFTAIMVFSFTFFDISQILEILAYESVEELHYYLDFYIIPGSIGSACLIVPWMQIFFNSVIMDRIRGSFRK